MCTNGLLSHTDADFAPYTTINQAGKYNQPVLTVFPDNYGGTDFAPHKPVAQFRALAGAQGAGSSAVTLYIYAMP